MGRPTPIQPETLWSYAVELYKTDSVAEACLHLQDEHDVDVPVLLACAWAVTQLGVDDPGLVRSCLESTRRWRSAVIVPLRQVRRSLKSQIEGFDHPDQLVLRAQVADLELAAERRQIDVLQTVVAALSTTPSGSPPQSARRFLDHLSAWPLTRRLADSDESLDAVATLVCAALPGFGLHAARKAVEDVLT